MQVADTSHSVPRGEAFFPQPASPLSVIPTSGTDISNLRQNPRGPGSAPSHHPLCVLCIASIKAFLSASSSPAHSHCFPWLLPGLSPIFSPTHAPWHRHRGPHEASTSAPSSTLLLWKLYAWILTVILYTHPTLPLEPSLFSANGTHLHSSKPSNGSLLPTR